MKKKNRANNFSRYDDEDKKPFLSQYIHPPMPSSSYLIQNDSDKHERSEMKVQISERCVGYLTHLAIIIFIILSNKKKQTLREKKLASLTFNKLDEISLDFFLRN